MKYFISDGEFITPVDKNWYHIIIAELPHYYEDGRHRWFPHLAEKNWFTEEMFWELLEFSRATFPATNFDKAVYQTAQIFALDGFYKNWDFHKMIHEMPVRTVGKESE